MDPKKLMAVPSTAAEALERIALPPEVSEQILSLVGSSLIVSDNALSDDTDADTDFIVLTPWKIAPRSTSSCCSSCSFPAGFEVQNNG